MRFLLGLEVKVNTREGPDDFTHILQINFHGTQEMFLVLNVSEKLISKENISLKLHKSLLSYIRMDLELLISIRVVQN